MKNNKNLHNTHQTECHDKKDDTLNKTNGSKEEQHKWEKSAVKDREDDAQELLKKNNSSHK